MTFSVKIRTREVLTLNRFKRAVRKIKTSLFKGAFVHNPILTQATGIFAVAGAAVSLRDSVALTFTAGITLLVCEGVTALLLKKLPRYIRVALYALISAIVVFSAEPVTLLLSKDSGRMLPFYFFLMGVNALIAVRCERFAVKNKLRYCIVDAFSATVGFGAVAIITGALRELITYGTLFHSSNSSPIISAGALPFIAFAILGLLAALHRWVVMKFYPDEQINTFSLKSSDEKINLRDPGLFSRKTKEFKKKDSENFDIIKLRGTERQEE